MPKLNAILSDVAREKDGVWVDFHGVRFKVRRAGGPEYERAYERIFQHVRRELRTGTAKPEEIHELNVALAAEYLVSDWAELEDDAGKPDPFSIERARTILGRPDARGVLAFIFTAARDEAIYRAELDGESLGNSSRSSTGS